MIKPVFSIRDTKTTFMAPFVDESRMSAARGFEFAIKNSDTKDSIMGFAPQDFELFHVGDFDTESGELIPKFPPKLIVSGISFLRDESEVDDEES